MPADLDHPVLRSLSGVETRRMPMGLPIAPRWIAAMLGLLAAYSVVVFLIVGSLGGTTPTP